MQRRKLLQTIGVGTISMGATVSTARSSESSNIKGDMKKANEIRDKKGIEAATDFLEDNGYRTGSKEFTKSIKLGVNEANTSGSVGTQKIEDPQDGGITVELLGVQEGFNDRVGIFVETSYDYRVKCLRGRWNNKSSGADPNDAVGIAWNSFQNEFFELAFGGGENAMSTPKHSEWNEDVHDPSRGRTGFNIDDKEAFLDWEDSLPNCTVYKGLDEEEEDEVYGTNCGLYLEPVGDWDPEDRVINVAYTHAWANISINPSVSFSSDGPALEFSPDWQVNDSTITTSDDGTNLEMSQAEII